MDCKFLKHGIAFTYDHIVRPCCEWTQDPSWDKQNHISQVDLKTWHQSPQVIQLRQQLANGTWPSGCQRCAVLEQQGRQDSLRGNGHSAYADYYDKDITLEIRPGSVCNFACQTCWPAASSRVAQYHHHAGLVDIKTVKNTPIDNFDFLLPIAERVRSVMLLGGEPFYDPSCKKFLAWSAQNLHADITMFTNGSHVDWTWVDAYPGNVTMVFSIDAVGKAAEYVRFGTDWPVVHKNYVQAQKHPRIELRVNITMSVYNYHLIEDVVKFLTPNWPKVVSFGVPTRINLRHLTEISIPMKNRQQIIASLARAVDHVMSSNIEKDQQYNAVNAIRSVIANLTKSNFDQLQFDKLKQIVNKLDQVKHTNIIESANLVNFS
jgi:sulfatase maturation enzyme AslB (radical SAM superfamily)